MEKSSFERNKLSVQNEIQLFKSANGNLSSIPTATVSQFVDKISNILELRTASQQPNNLDRVKEGSTVNNNEKEVAHSSKEIPVGTHHDGDRRKELTKKSINGVFSQFLAIIDQEDESDDGDIEMMTNEQKLAMNQVVTNPLLVKLMIDKLDLLDLLSCRRVNKTWTSLTADLILTRNCTIVSLDYNEKLKTFGKCPQPKKMSRYCHGRVRYELPAPPPRDRLKTLNKILEKSSLFPCTDFAFLNKYNRNNESLLRKGSKGYVDLDKFFKIQGPSIKTLKLVSFSNDDVEQVLMSRTPQLEILEVIDPGGKDLQNQQEMDRLGDEDYTSSEEESDQDDLSYITKLKTLNFDAHVKLFKKIVNNSPNLSLIQIPRVFGLSFYLDQLLKTNRIKLINKLVLLDSTYIERFCGNGPDDQVKLEKLVLSLFASKYDSIMRDYFHEDVDHSPAQEMLKLLEATKDTLVSLDLSIIGYFNINQLPIFHRLKKLKVGDGAEYKARRCFPLGTNLSLLCPNLQTLDCTGFNCGKDSRWIVQFPDGGYSGNFSGVTKLKIPDFCTDIWFQKLQNLCPNFKNVVVYHNGGDNRLEKLLLQIFKFWTHLESLKIKIVDQSIQNGNESIRGLDSTLTGLSDQECDALNLRWSFGVALRHVERSNPSLLDLKELKLLEFQLRSSWAHEVFVGDNWSQVFMTWVTGVYVFRLMPQLCVKFQFDQNCSMTKEIESRLLPIEEFINLSHRKLLHSF